LPLLVESCIDTFTVPAFELVLDEEDDCSLLPPQLYTK